MSNVGTPENTLALGQAAFLLKTAPQDLPPNVSLLLAHLFTKWARMGRFDLDLLNRVGGEETITLAHAIIEHLTPAEETP